MVASLMMQDLWGDSQGGPPGWASYARCISLVPCAVRECGNGFLGLLLGDLIRDYPRDPFPHSLLGAREFKPGNPHYPKAFNSPPLNLSTLTGPNINRVLVLGGR